MTEGLSSCLGLGMLVEEVIEVGAREPLGVMRMFYVDHSCG